MTVVVDAGKQFVCDVVVVVIVVCARIPVDDTDRRQMNNKIIYSHTRETHLHTLTCGARHG